MERKYRQASWIFLSLIGAQLTWLFRFRLCRGNCWFERDHVTTAGLQQVQTKQQAPTFGLVVVHCSRNPEITWLDDVPSDWKLTVYETCGKNISRGSIPFQNRGHEECTGYFQYILDNYHDLPDINVFLQDDAMFEYKDRPGQAGLWHTPFRTIAALENATLPHFIQGHGFLHYGRANLDWLDTVRHDSYMLDYVGEIWDDLNLTHTNKTLFSFIPKACFAVHRDRILANSRELYFTLQQKILVDKNPDRNGHARQRCCALERAWPVVFGEPAILTKNSTLDNYLEKVGFQFGDLIGR